jgi:GNAT superfamily N-acetyltransferase
LSPVFRKATEEDYPVISKIHNAQNEPDLHRSPEQLKHLDDACAQRDATYRRYVAVDRGEVVATGYFRSDWGGVTYPDRCWVGIYTRRDRRQRGLDTQLLHHGLRQLDPPAREVWTVVREDFLDQADFLGDEGFEVQGRTWGAHLDLGAFDPNKFQDVRARLEAEGVRFLPYHALNDPDKHRKVQALHAEAKRDMPLFEPVVTTEFDDVEDEATLLETVMVAVNGEGEIVGVSSIDRGVSMLHFGLTAVTAPYRNRGICRVLKALTTGAAKASGHVHVNSGGAGTDTPILRVNRALGFEIEPAWLTLAQR